MRKRSNMPIVRFSQPYRGQPRPKYPKVKRQFRNLYREKWENKTTIIILFLFSLFVLIYGLYKFQINHNPGTLIISLIIFSILLTITLAITNGLTSVNKFRKDYDIDISASEEKDEDKKIDESDKYLDS